MISRRHTSGIALTLCLLFLSFFRATLAAPIGTTAPNQEAVLAKRAPTNYYQLHHSRSINRRALEADYTASLLRRSFEESPILEARSFDGLDEHETFMVKRDVSHPATGNIQRLVRRKSIFTRIKEAFKKAGKAIKKGFQKLGNGIKKVAGKVKEGFKKAGKAIKKGFQKVGKTFKKVGQKIKSGFQKAGKAIKKGFQKAGQWIKKNGATIAKFGLKIWSTAASIASKVAKFIPVPGLNNIVSKALSAESKLLDFGANKIKANLGSKLEKGFKIMDKIQHPLSGAAGAILDNFKRDEEGSHLFARELFAPHPEELFVRDLPASDLEARSFEDGEMLEARSFKELEARSFDDFAELEARSFDDFEELNARSLFEEDDY